MNKVTVLTAGHVQAIAGRHLIPGAADDGARRVASTVTLIMNGGASHHGHASRRTTIGMRHSLGQTCRYLLFVGHVSPSP